MVVPANDATIAAGFDVGDELIFRFREEEGTARSEPIIFTIVGMSDKRNEGIEIEFGSDYYVPLEFLPSGQELNIDSQEVSVIIDADEDKISAISSTLLEIPGVFVLETRLLNDLIDKILNQFTNFPILVAALALFTGGVVIANSVALSMMERRREIAIMKAVGVSRRRVLGMLLMENGLMGLIGGLIGVGIGAVILFIMLTSLFPEELGTSIPYTTALLLMLACVGIALIASMLSVWNATSEKPLNVLRYE
jgi:ABC-type antimicrobial peptide transport system permease subunit